MQNKDGVCAGRGAVTVHLFQQEEVYLTAREVVVAPRAAAHAYQNEAIALVRLRNPGPAKFTARTASTNGEACGYGAADRRAEKS